MKEPLTNIPDYIARERIERRRAKEAERRKLRLEGERQGLRKGAEDNAATRTEDGGR